MRLILNVTIIWASRTFIPISGVDLLKLAETYGIKYTGGVIENYDDTSGNVHSQKIDRFKYFGKITFG